MNKNIINVNHIFTDINFISELKSDGIAFSLSK